MQNGKLWLITKALTPILNPSLALPLQRRGNKISSLPPLQGGIKGGYETCVYSVAPKGYEGLLKIKIKLFLELTMTDLFSPEWMQSFGEQWNAEPDLADALAKIHFNSVIGYGFENDPNPTGVLTIEEGRVIASGAYTEQILNWDLRADLAHWEKWKTKGLDMVGLGMAYMSRKLQFRVGDYMAMIKDPRMATPFIKSFAVMSKV